MINRTTLNSFSISLASTKGKIFAFSLAYAVAIFLYWTSFSGQPIWDDMTFWFYDPIMAPEYSHLEIWKKFTWPVSVSAQKILMQIGGMQWWFYHWMNFVFHCFNAWLVFQFMRLLRTRYLYCFFGFLLFLYHPANVLAVAWMIQFKTLLCFTLGLGALSLYLRAKGFRDHVLANLLFLLSVLSKSSSIPLPLVMLFLLGKSWKTKRCLTLVPFFLIMSFGVYRIAHSELTREGVKHASKMAASEVDEKPSSFTSPEIEQAPPAEKTASDPKEVRIFKPLPDEPFSEGPVPAVKAPEARIGSATDRDFGEELKPFLDQGRLLLKTAYYYFWQVYLPIDSSPVKGLNPFPPGVLEYLHLFFLLIVAAATWNTPLFSRLMAAHFLLLPYLGLVPAPYMLVTWVSDQHLYLAMPCFILFFFGCVEKLKVRWVVPPVLSLLIYFGVKTHQASSFYKDNFTFYEQSIKANQNNIPLVYNLSILYIAHGRNRDAADLVESIILLGREHKYLTENRYYPYLVHVYTQLIPDSALVK